MRAFLAISFLAAGISLGAPAGPALKAGVAKVELTPPAELKASLGGYGDRMNKPAVGVHDAVWVKALVLLDGERRFAMVTADLLGFPPQFKAEVMRRLQNDGWSSGQVLLLPSHSHTSVDMMALHPANHFGIPQVGIFDKALMDWTAERLVRVIREAAKAPVPILCGSKQVQVPNRNRNRRAGGTVHDSTLTVTRIDAVDKKENHPLAVLVNWTAHPTFMDAEDMMFSGDWPGHLQRTVEALIGQGATVMYYNGAEGDQSPTPPSDCKSHWERAERYGREMGIIAWRTWERIQPYKVKEFSFHSENIVLPPRHPHPDFMKTGGTEYGLSETMIQGFLEQLLPKQTSTTCLRLGDLMILGVPGELAAGLGMEAKSKAHELTGVPCVTIGGLADEWVSYILPAEEYRKGGYEASMSSYGETLGQTITQGVIRCAAGLQKAR